MSHSTTTKPTDILHTLRNGEGSPKPESTSLIVREKIENSPFYVIGNEEKGYMIVLGKNIVTDPVPTIEECKQQLQTGMWNIILKVAAIVHEAIAKEVADQIEKENKEQSGPIHGSYKIPD